MKIALLSLCLLSFSAAAQMQPVMLTRAEVAAKEIEMGKEMAEPFKGANVIIIHTSDSVAVALRKMARALIMAGIEPDKIDAEIGYLTTKDKSVGDFSPAIYQYKVISTAEHGGTALAITGNFTTRISLTQTMSVPMVWTKGSLLKAKQCFAMIEAVALAYQGAQIGYISKPERPTIRR